MPVDFASLREQVRREVHDTLGVPAFYRATSAAEEIELKVRWHTKSKALGDLEDNGYGLVIEGVNRVAFDRAEIVEKGVTLRKAGRLRIPGAGQPDVLLTLDTREKDDGPVVEWWGVVHP